MHARDKRNSLNWAPFVIFERAASVFKRAIYAVRKVLSREMKDYNKFTYVYNSVDIHGVCQVFE